MKKPRTTKRKKEEFDIDFLPGDADEMELLRWGVAFFILAFIGGIIVCIAEASLYPLILALVTFFIITSFVMVPLSLLYIIRNIFRAVMPKRGLCILAASITCSLLSYLILFFVDGIVTSHSQPEKIEMEVKKLEDAARNGQPIVYDPDSPAWKEFLRRAPKREQEKREQERLKQEKQEKEDREKKEHLRIKHEKAEEEARKRTENEKRQKECAIKGNINRNGVRIYHMPGQEYYSSTIINEAYGERWFCSEQEAINAGWRKSKV